MDTLFYKRIGLHFVSHTTSAREVFSKSEFFNRGESGGTYISTGYEKALEILDSYDKEMVDIYVIHLSDGDNWGEDNDKAVELAQKISDKATVFQFVEIKDSRYVSSISERFVNEIKDGNFVFVQVRNQDTIDNMIRNPLLFEQKMGNQNWLNKR